MESIRQKKVQQFIKEEVSEIIRSKVSDPRISAVTTIIAVRVTRDMRKADLYVSFLGSDADKKTTMRGLNSSRAFIQKELARAFSSNIVPSIEFFEDDSVEKSINMDQLIQQARASDIDQGEED